MRNKWFVGGILVPAVFFGWGTVMALRSDTWILAIVPLGIAIGLVGLAYKVSKADSFSPVRTVRWDSGTSDAVKRWNIHREEVDAAVKAAAAAKKP